jgi:uncharacterized protein HemY
MTLRALRKSGTIVMDLIPANKYIVLIQRKIYNTKEDLQSNVVKLVIFVVGLILFWLVGAKIFKTRSQSSADHFIFIVL